MRMYSIPMSNFGLFLQLLFLTALIVTYMVYVHGENVIYVAYGFGMKLAIAAIGGLIYWLFKSLR